MAYNILIVDDSEAMRVVIKKILRMTGLEILVLEACSGSEALSLLEEQWVDMVLTDIHMPNMSGVELIEKIRNNQELQKLPVMVVSTEGREDFLAKTQELGVAGYLKKPFQPTELRNAILAILEENNAHIQPTTANDDEDGDF